jgi:hypothetical protein
MSQEEDLAAAAMLSAVAGYPPPKFAAQAGLFALMSGRPFPPLVSGWHVS